MKRPIWVAILRICTRPVLTREIKNSIEDTVSELDDTRAKPAWLERDLDLPFSKLSGDEFEVLCFLLLKAKYPNDRIYYYGKTSDMGRDIVHILSSGRVRLIQCKNFAVNVDKSKIGAEMAKVYVNVHTKRIPEKPDEVVFFVSKDLSANAKDLIQYQQKWLESAEKYLATHLGSAPSQELLEFAKSWWPFGDSQSGISITADIQKYHGALNEEFFAVKKVIDASREEVRQDVREELGAAFQEFLVSRTSNDDNRISKSLPPAAEVQASFLAASKPLLNWPQKVGDNRWIERAEADLILDSLKGDDCVEGWALLGEPGSGKSALLANIANQLKENGIPFLAIKADTLGVNVDSIGKLSEHLRLPGNLLDCAKSLASDGRLVVLIDQLDALSDLCDLRSERLNVLLDVINRLSLIQNVCVVASCRGFEFRHDARFRTIDLEEMNLTLPEWESISDLLKQQGVDGTNWPSSFSEILRTPQNLKVFLQLLRKGDTEHQIFDSYQGMLEELWTQKVTKSADATVKWDLLDRIAGAMSEQEVMWLPAINFESERSTISQLVGDGILKMSENQLKLGFQHQTLFSHARARAFLKGGLDLFDFVVARQHALFVRPTLWSTLGYLREASREEYRRQMEKLCSGSLRLHVQHLLLDFLGRLNDPHDFEEVWLIRWLEDSDYKVRAICAIARSEGWFARLKDTQLVALMCNPEGVEWPLTSLLRESVNHSRKSTFDLIEKYWIPEPKYDVYTFRVFDNFQHWDLESVELICTLVARMEIDEVYVTGLASQVSVSQPTLAPKILAAELAKTLNRLKGEADPPVKELSTDATMVDRWVEQIAHEPKRRFCSFLESSGGRYDYPAIAEAAPFEFLNEIWSLFVDGVRQTIDDRQNDGGEYARSRRLMYDFDGELSRNSPFIEAIQVALAELGKTDPARFEAFIESNVSCEFMLIQRLLCRSLTTVEPTKTDLTFRYLTPDPRRLFVGGYDDYYSDSRSLIQKVATELSSTQLAELEASIATWFENRPEHPDVPPKDRRRFKKYDREHRLRLLMAIPEDLLSEENRSLCSEEDVSLPTVKFRMGSSRKRGLISCAKSPMSTEQMKQAKDAHILNLFDGLTDDLNWEPIEASRALADLAKEDPDRVVSLAKQLRPKDQQVPAEHVVRALSESSFSDDKIFAFIHEMVGLGFDSPHFQDAVAWTCYKRVGNRTGLPDDICALLKTWLENWKFADPPDVRKGEQETEEERKRSVVFDLLGGYSLPSGTFWILSALAYGFIRKEPRQTAEWLDVLESHVERPDLSRTWQVLCSDLRMLSYCEPEMVNAFLTKLFTKYPAVRDSRFGVRLILDLRNFLGDAAVEAFYDQYVISDWPMGKQVAGELYGISYLAEDGFAFADEYVLRVMAPDSTEDNSTLKGIAFAIANLWKEPEIQESATELFECLAKRNCEQVNKALCDVFWFDRFVPNKNSKRILQLAEQFPELIRHVDAYRFAEMLELFATSIPEVVLKLSNALLDQLEVPGEKEFRRNFDLADAALTSISMTLQRMNNDLRGRGLDLFERLLKIGFTSTSETIKELDSRPVAVNSVRRRRRRRKP